MISNQPSRRHNSVGNIMSDFILIAVDAIIIYVNIIHAMDQDYPD
jgi:hypothetical protein